MSTTPTARDRVWDAVIHALDDSDKEYTAQSDIRDYIDDDVSTSIINFVMWSITDKGYLAHRKGDKYWHHGPKTVEITEK